MESNTLTHAEDSETWLLKGYSSVNVKDSLVNRAS
jgi:hypothetical protein